MLLLLCLLHCLTLRCKGQSCLVQSNQEHSWCVISMPRCFASLILCQMLFCCCVTSWHWCGVCSERRLRAGKCWPWEQDQEPAAFALQACRDLFQFIAPKMCLKYRAMPPLPFLLLSQASFDLKQAFALLRLSFSILEWDLLIPLHLQVCGVQPC